MIFNWEKKFSENQVLNGIDLMYDITEMDRTIDSLSGYVNENCEEYWVSIELDDDFNIKSMKCSCAKSKCHHMTALIQADTEYFKKDMDCRTFVDDIDDDKLIDFLKDQLVYNEEFQMDFIDEFRDGMLKNDKLETEDKLFLILNSPKWDDLLTDFVKNDLTKLYDEEKYHETFYLITAMFYKVIQEISFSEDSKLVPCYNILEDLIIKLSEMEPELIKKFIHECREDGYGMIYPEFRKLISKLDL